MKVSVVIPCYQCAAFIRKAVNSVLSQDYHDLELICVDDGSRDNTLEVLESMRPDIERRMPFQLIFQENAGANAARNAGIAQSSGTYIQFLDADDELLPGKISSQISLAQSSSLPSIVVGGYARQRANGDILFTRKYTDQDQSRMWQLLLNTNLGITSSNLFLAEAVRSVQGWNPEMKSSQEYDLMFRILQHGGTLTFDSGVHTCVLHRETGSISRTNEGANAERYIGLRLRIRDHLKSTGDTANVKLADEALFDAIRTLYRYHPEEAVKLFRAHLPDFHPRQRKGGGRAYAAMFSVLGFRLTEHIYHLLKRN